MSTTFESDRSSTIPQDKTFEERPQSYSMRAQQASFWSDAAPKRIAGKASWETWVRHLEKRRKPKMVDDLCSASKTALFWGLNLGGLSPLTIELLQHLEQATSQAKLHETTVKESLLLWVQGSNVQPQSIDFAMECLAVANLLPQIAPLGERDFWWSLFDALGEIVSCMIDWQIDAEMPPETCLVQQLLAGELPLTLAYLFPEMRPLAKLRKAAHDALSDGLIELTNGEGLPRASHVDYFRSLVACWTRCQAMALAMNKRPWSSKAQMQYQYALARSLLLSSASGVPLLARENSAPWSPDFLEAVVRSSETPAERTAALDMLERKLSKHLTGKSGKVVPETSYQCEWSGLAVLRTEYTQCAPVVAIDYASPDLRIEAWLGSQRVLAGIWTAKTSSGGMNLEPAGVWEQTCWFSDEDVDYLELALDLAHGARLERQILLARDDQFLLLTDLILDAPSDSIHHQLSLPLAAEVEFHPEVETREGTLLAAGFGARVMPLALPEWRTDPRLGELTQTANQLQLTQERPGRRMACPLLIDLDPARIGKPCTWRQLTVAQALEIQPPDVAVGYRAQAGKAQWLIYRSLAPRANRSVLGQNTSVEYLVGRFLAPSGEVEELLQVEG